MADADASQLADLAIEKADQVRALNCRMLDDHQTHSQRALEQLLPAKLASKMIDATARYLDHSIEGAQQWNATHHRDGLPPAPTDTGVDTTAPLAGASETPSPRGRPSMVQRVLTHPLTVAAATGATIYGATKLFQAPAPEQGPGSVYQYLEDQGYHVAQRAMNDAESQILRNHVSELQSLNASGMEATMAIAKTMDHYIRAPWLFARDMVNEYLGNDAGFLNQFTAERGDREDAGPIFGKWTSRDNQ